jgi:Mrp family chromosome partitioning ATPase
MPTDISTPIWVCAICGERFGNNLDAAARCESAGIPPFLPDGELLLQYSRYGSATVGIPRGFYLARLQRLERFGTHATQWNQQRGHFARYQAILSAASDRSRHEWPTYTADRLWPHQPGQHLLVIPRGRHEHSLADNEPGFTGGVCAWPFDRVGLPHDPGQVANLSNRLGGVRLARPITPEVRAVFDLLRATVESPRVGASWWFASRDGQSVIAAERTSRRDGLPDGVYDATRAAWWLAQCHEADLIEEIRDRQTRWMRGEPLTVPLPLMRSTYYRRGGYKLSASKLTKTDQAIIDATGLAWPPRTSADEYLDLLVATRLGVKMTTTEDVAGHSGRALFGGVRRRIAVTSSKGGVGKSTVAAALGAALAAAGETVVLVDLNLPNPGQHILWQLGPAQTDVDRGLVRPTRVLAPPQVPGTLEVFSHGQLAPPDDPAAALIDLAKAPPWISFLAGTLDLAGASAIIFDLPPGWDAVLQQIFDPYVVPLTGCVHVTTGHPLAVSTETLPARHRMHRGEGPAHWLVENLSRARVTTAAGRQVDGHLYGAGDAVRELAEREQVSYAGSLPWEPELARLARSVEVAALAATILDTTTTPEDDLAQPEPTTA